MFTLNGIGEDRRLTARFPAVHEHAQTEIFFQRTLRVPDDGNKYPLPVGLGVFPLRHLEDYEENLPSAWASRGGLILPMYRADAMWIAFDQRYPCAIKIAAGRINALSGERWTERLDGSRQDYVVAPPQAALDGFCTGKDEVRQFVAVPLARGEEMIEDPEHGGIQIVVHPMKRDRYERLRVEWSRQRGSDDDMDIPSGDMSAWAQAPRPLTIGLAVGGRMTERVIQDPYGVDAWDQKARIRCFVSLVDAQQWPRITGGGLPPMQPFTPEDYEREGLPWFEYGHADLQGLEGEPRLAAEKSPARIAPEGGLGVLPFTSGVSPSNVEQVRLVRPPHRSRHPNPLVRSYWTARRKLLRQHPQG